MDGQIDVDSKQGVGTTFIVTLPFWIDEVAAKGSQEETHVKALVGS
jgi:signal transduction histidine kinase